MCGAAVVAFGSGDRGDFGGFEDRGGLSADRPGGADGADAVHARADAAPIAAITTAGLAGRLDGCDLLVIDVDDPALTANPAPHCRRRPPMTSLTSFTPRAPPVCPKGVAVTHHNVTQLMGSLDAGLPAAGVWPQCHSLAFDVSVWEIFGALLRGGRLVVVPESVVALTGGLPRGAGR